MDDLRKQKTYVIAFKVGSLLSILGTCYIIYEVLSDRKKRSRTYFRLLLGMSVFELTESLALFCGPWCAPSNFTAVWSSSGVGSMATCKAQGFLHQFSIGSVFYSCVLALYYVLAIKYNIVERIIRQRYEPWMHIFSIMLSVGTSITVILLDLIKPMGNICRIGRTPGNCLQSYQNDGHTTCTQGDNSQLYLLIFNVIAYSISFFTTAACMFVVWWKIRHQENRNSRYQFPSPSSSTTTTTRSISSGSIGPTPPLPPQHTNPQRKHSQRFAVQGSLYVGIMYICNIWSAIQAVKMQMNNGTRNPNLSLIASFIKPLEGFFILLIYLRPKYLKYRQRQLQRQKNETQTSQQESTTGSDERYPFDKRISSRLIKLGDSVRNVMSWKYEGEGMAPEGSNNSTAGGVEDVKNDSNNERHTTTADDSVQPPPVEQAKQQTVDNILQPQMLEAGIELQQDEEEQVELGAY